MRSLLLTMALRQPRVDISMQAEKIALSYLNGDGRTSDLKISEFKSCFM